MKKKYYEVKVGHGWFGGYMRETDVISTVDSGMWKWHILIAEKFDEMNEIIERERESETMNENRKEGDLANVRIRKLTPKECWRSSYGFYR